MEWRTLLPHDANSLSYLWVRQDGVGLLLNVHRVDELIHCIVPRSAWHKCGRGLGEAE